MSARRTRDARDRVTFSRLEAATGRRGQSATVEVGEEAPRHAST